MGKQKEAGSGGGGKKPQEKQADGGNDNAAAASSTAQGLAGASKGKATKKKKKAANPQPKNKGPPKFKTFFFKHLGRSEGAANNLYKILVREGYNNFDDITLVKRETIPDGQSSKMVERLLVLIEFVRLQGDYRSDLSFHEVQEQVTEAELKQCFIPRLNQPPVNPNMDDELVFLMKKAFVAQLDPYETISESHYSQQDSAEVRNSSIAYYGLNSEKHCQMLGPNQFEHVKVVNAYIWPRHATDQLPVFGLAKSQIHNPRNVLRLQKCLERAFDHKEITFVQGDTAKEFKLKVLNKNLKDTVLKGTQITFASLDGRPLQMNQEEHRSYTRLLAHHALLGFRKAREQNWLEESDDLSHEEVQAGNLMGYSLDECAQARIKLMFKR